MIRYDEEKVDKQAIIGRKFEVISLREDRGIYHKSMFYIWVRLSGQLIAGINPQTQKKTMINSDAFLTDLRNEGKLIGAILKIEEYVRPEKGYYYFKYEVVREGRIEDKKTQ